MLKQTTSPGLCHLSRINENLKVEKFIKDKPLAASFSILCVLRGVHSKVCLSSRTEPHKGTILNSKVYSNNGYKLIFMNKRKIKWFQEVREEVKSPGQT
jgi:hypothetical protein